MSSAKQSFLLRILPLMFVVVGAGMAFFGIRDIVRAKGSVNWPTVHGKIVSSSVEILHTRTGTSGKRSSTIYARLFYTFSVDGKSYTGNRVCYGDYNSEGPSHAYRVVNRYPKGKDVRVYYMPDNPKVCLLEPGNQRGSYITPGIGLFLFILGSLAAMITRKVMRE